MNNEIIGRADEQAILKELLAHNKSDLLAVYGRRRVGKTYLIKTYYKKEIIFECSGAVEATTSQQLNNFAVQFFRYFKTRKAVKIANWQEAFFMLETALKKIKSKRKKVLFFDELPRLDTHKSGFLPAFSYWWNMYGSQRSDLLVVICGSSASWMINKIVNHKGSLHNRITQRIRLLPFTLKETEAYMQYKKVQLTRYQIVQLYMVLGGVPQYLNGLERGKSVAQNINKTCFTKDGLMANEFQNLYVSLFNNPEKHLHVTKLLSQKIKGLTRSEIVKSSAKLSSGGGISKVLEELTESGFIDKIIPFRKKVKDTVYRLSDEYTMFYLKFMDHNIKGSDGWQQVVASNAFNIWCGYAFEGICIKHINAIKRKLGIAGVYTEQSSWRLHGSKNNKGTQVDLLIDRKDGCINLCEIKFSNNVFELSRAYAAALDEKKRILKSHTKTRKSVFTTMITTFGVAGNQYKAQQIDSEIILDDLFRK